MSKIMDMLGILSKPQDATEKKSPRKKFSRKQEDETTQPIREVPPVGASAIHTAATQFTDTAVNPRSRVDADGAVEYKTVNYVPDTADPEGPEIVFRMLKEIDDSYSVIYDLMDGKLVIFDLDSVDDKLGRQRYLDIICGGTKALEGNIRQIPGNGWNFIAVPRGTIMITERELTDEITRHRDQANTYRGMRG